MTRGVDERDPMVTHLRLIGADVLGDAAGLTRNHVGATNAVEQLSLAVIDMAHDRDDRRSTRSADFSSENSRLGRIVGASRAQAPWRRQRPR